MNTFSFYGGVKNVKQSTLKDCIVMIVISFCHPLVYSTWRLYEKGHMDIDFSFELH